MPDDLEERRVKVLREYLREYFIKPSLTVDQKKSLLDAITNKEGRIKNLVGIKAWNLMDMKQIIQFYILAFQRRVHWGSYNTFEFVDIMLTDGQSLLDTMSQYPVLIIYHGIKEMVNKRLFDLTNQVIEYRKMSPDLYTLVVSSKEWDKINAVEFVDVLGIVGQDSGGLSTDVL